MHRDRSSTCPSPDRSTGPPGTTARSVFEPLTGEEVRDRRAPVAPAGVDAGQEQKHEHDEGEEGDPPRPPRPPSPGPPPAALPRAHECPPSARCADVDDRPRRDAGDRRARAPRGSHRMERACPNTIRTACGTASSDAPSPRGSSRTHTDPIRKSRSSRLRRSAPSTVREPRSVNAEPPRRKLGQESPTRLLGGGHRDRTALSSVSADAVARAVLSRAASGDDVRVPTRASRDVPAVAAPICSGPSEMRLLPDRHRRTAARASSFRVGP